MLSFVSGFIVSFQMMVKLQARLQASRPLTPVCAGSLHVGQQCLVQDRDGQLKRAEVLAFSETTRGGLRFNVDAEVLLVDEGVRRGVPHPETLLECPDGCGTEAVPPGSFEVILAGFRPKGTKKKNGCNCLRNG